MSNWVKFMLDLQKHLAIPKREIHNFQIFAIVVMDVIWFTRNQVVHNNSYKLDITSLLKQINITVKSHLQAWKNKSPTRSLWKPPPLGFLKANFDLAIRSKFSVASVVNSDETEMVIAACSRKLDSTKVIVHGGKHMQHS